ncbi:MAG: phosphoribosylformylglycinamidine synthase subunit PurS [Gemmatimonadetes bacterium]|nr:phosphoribosylformylglycinamidine synthase subunit PurS [Gemmatimonadota bacterium]
MKLRVPVQVLPRHGILDPQGKAVTDALHTLGFAQVGDVHVGRHLAIEVEAASPAAASDAVRAMCAKLLANPVTEDFVIGAPEAM